eukprot:GILJ01007914.1.p1 GENE.GILJ01007914.1~~GILJ01007914.1.p1  ORF type:complete len:248 (-),score=17.99 GILJ01007914.1:64-807(-)
MADTLEALIEEYEAAQEEYALVKQRLEQSKTRLLSALVDCVNTTRRRPLIFSNRDFDMPFRRPEPLRLGLYLHDEGFESNLQSLLCESLSHAGVVASVCASDMCQCVLFMYRVNSARETILTDLVQQIQSQRINIDGKTLVLVGMKLRASGFRATYSDRLDDIFKGKQNSGPTSIHSITFQFEQNRDPSTGNYIFTVTRDSINEGALSALTQLLLPLAVPQQSREQQCVPSDRNRWLPSHRPQYNHH